MVKGDKMVQPHRVSLSLSREAVKRLEVVSKKELTLTKSELLRRALILGLKQLEAGNNGRRHSFADNN